MRLVRPCSILLASIVVGCPAPSPTPQSATSSVTSPTTSTAEATAAAPAAGNAAAAPTTETATVVIAKTYTGRISIPMKSPGKIPDKVAARVIRDAEAMADFVSMIPKKAITMKQPAPASDDPLLKPLSIDFSKQMVVVVFRTDSMYTPAKLENPRVVAGQLTLDVTRPPLGAPMAEAMGIGTYCAVLVSRVDGEVNLIGE